MKPKVTTTTQLYQILLYEWKEYECTFNDFLQEHYDVEHLLPHINKDELNRGNDYNVYEKVLEEVGIPEQDLVIGVWYKGEGRFTGNIGLWDGKLFHGFTFKFGKCLDTNAVYGARGFTPLEILGTD